MWGLLTRGNPPKAVKTGKQKGIMLVSFAQRSYPLARDASDMGHELRFPGPRKLICAWFIGASCIAN
jgi:hypothetical protein